MNDHGPQPCESLEYTVFLTNNPSSQSIVLHPTTTGVDPNQWNRAVLSKIFTDGWYTTRAPDPVGHGSTCGDTANYSVEQDSFVAGLLAPVRHHLPLRRDRRRQRRARLPRVRVRLAGGRARRGRRPHRVAAPACAPTPTATLRRLQLPRRAAGLRLRRRRSQHPPRRARGVRRAQGLQLQRAPPRAVRRGPRLLAEHLHPAVRRAGVPLPRRLDLPARRLRPEPLHPAGLHRRRLPARRDVRPQEQDVRPRLRGRRLPGGAEVRGRPVRRPVLARSSARRTGTAAAARACRRAAASRATSAAATPAPHATARRKAAAARNQCVDPTCVGVTCPAAQHCSGGACVDLCSGVVCPPGEVLPPVERDRLGRLRAA